MNISLFLMKKIIFRFTSLEENSKWMKSKLEKIKQASPREVLVYEGESCQDNSDYSNCS